VLQILGAGGGAFLIIFGLRLISAKEEKPKDVNKEVVQGSLFKSMLSGFLINSLNPSALLFWIATVSTVTAEFSKNTKLIFIFFIVSMSIVFGTDVLKAFLAARVKTLVTAKFLHRLHRFTGIALLAVGVEKLGAAALTYFNWHPFGMGL
jgi:threonine/homoserine/homoserine lactone efflux protein